MAQPPHLYGGTPHHPGTALPSSHPAPFNNQQLDSRAVLSSLAVSLPCCTFPQNIYMVSFYHAGLIHASVTQAFPTQSPGAL